MERQNNPPPGTSNTSAEKVSKIKQSITETLENMESIFNDDELPKDYSKKQGGINWLKMRNIIKKQVLTHLKESWEDMWETENICSKLITLNEIKRKTENTGKAWRPKAGDIGPQKKSLEAKMLLVEIESLSQINKEKEKKVQALKQQLGEEWDEVRHLEKRLTHYQKVVNSLNTSSKNNPKPVTDRKVDSHIDSPDLEQDLSCQFELYFPVPEKIHVEELTNLDSLWEHTLKVMQA